MSKPFKTLARVAPAPVGRLMQRIQAAVKNYAFYCPVCERRVGKFLPMLPRLPRIAGIWEKYGFDLQRFVQSETFSFLHYSCPWCLSSDRCRLFALFVRGEAAKIAPGGKPRMLDIGPTRPLKRLFLKLGYDHRSADQNMEGVDDILDVTHMPGYADNSFDCFICSHVLEHVKDDRAAMAELHRVLKPGGWGIAMVPMPFSQTSTDEDPALEDIGERTRRFGQDDHVRMYARLDFVKRLQQAGFTVDQLGLQHFGGEVFYKHGITQSSVLYVCRKN